MNAERVRNGLRANYKGELTEIAVAHAFKANGYKVSVPLGTDCRYDLIVDLDGVLSRVQCKTSVFRPKEMTVEFNCCSGSYAGSDGSSNYNCDVEFIATYNRKVKRVFLVPISIGNIRSCTLRLEGCKLKKDKRAKWAKDFELVF